MPGPFTGIGEQQTSFAVALGEMALKKKMQDDMIRQATIDNLINYIRHDYETRHAEGVARRQQQQGMVMRGASIGGALAVGPLIGAIGGAGGAATAVSGIAGTSGVAGTGMDASSNALFSGADFGSGASPYGFAAGGTAI